LKNKFYADIDFEEAEDAMARYDDSDEMDRSIEAEVYHPNSK
jgi:hypothetical protein